MSRRYDAVFFDLDGTLIDSREDLAAAVNHVRASLRLGPLQVPVVQSYIGDGVRLLLERSLGTTDDALLERALGLMRPYYLEHCLDRTTLYDGIGDLLQALGADPGLRLGVVTNKPQVPSEKVLNGLGLLGRFATVVGGDAAGARKPDPAPFRLAAERAGVVGGKILVVGDSPNDIEGARRAGYASCGVLWGICPPDRVRASRPDCEAFCPDDVRRLVLP